MSSHDDNNSSNCAELSSTCTCFFLPFSPATSSVRMSTGSLTVDTLSLDMIIRADQSKSTRLAPATAAARSPATALSSSRRDSNTEPHTAAAPSLNPSATQSFTTWSLVRSSPAAANKTLSSASASGRVAADAPNACSENDRPLIRSTTPCTN
eukprot:TRINITY_DN66705_c2_g3_i3.p1 TRINITY_DN66705_c2_g3~~TRINITY_DN66705_c2_g3_i3.p1  ORF type:complete len:153 (+),score=28.61 TRINITY_DN66705_c2_g3_i3:246-704(+)